MKANVVRTMRAVPVFAIGALIVTAGCSRNAPSAQMARVAHAPVYDSGSAGEETAGTAASNAASTAETIKTMDADGGAKLTLANLTDQTTDRYLIKNGTITVETKDVRGAMQKLTEAVRAMQGYVSDEHETVDSLESRAITITVRVPYRQFDGIVGQIETLGKSLEKSVTAQDVTEEFVDTESKTRNLKATESRLLAHLSKTGKLGDTLLVEKELNRVRAEIEQLEGRLRFLTHRISYSTLTVTLRETAHPQAITPPETFSSGKVASDALRSLIGFGLNVWSTLIWVGLWAVVWLPALLLVRFARGRTRRVVLPPASPVSRPPNASETAASRPIR